MIHCQIYDTEADDAEKNSHSLTLHAAVAEQFH